MKEITRTNQNPNKGKRRFASLPFIA